MHNGIDLIVDKSQIGTMFLYMFCLSVYSVHVFGDNFSFLDLVDKAVLLECRHFIPRLSYEHQKGERGRIGVFGGSEEYTSGPYFGAMASLRTGADMVYIFCASQAAIPIKSYSPDFMVLPCLDSDNALDLIKPWLERIHGILIGPGLGRNKKIIQNIIKIIELLKEDDDGGIPIVLDADAFYILYSHPQLLQGYPNQVYLTPNEAEFKQLASVILQIKTVDAIDPHEHLRTLAEKLGPKVTILLKGKIDRIAHGDLVTCNNMRGSPRRSGGQGDLLAGCLTALVVWLESAEFWRPQVHLTHPQLVSYAASAIIKLANRLAYRDHGRSLLASDVLSKIHQAFNLLFNEN